MFGFGIRYVSSVALTLQFSSTATVLSLTCGFFSAVLTPDVNLSCKENKTARSKTFIEFTVSDVLCLELLILKLNKVKFVFFLIRTKPRFVG